MVLDANGNANTDEDFIGNINPIRYRSYYYDVETNLYYLETRYYDPEIGRFISPDNYYDINSLNGLNLYVYCLNNPVSRIDTNGNSWWDITTWDWAAIGRGALSTLMIIGGIALCTVPGLQMVGAGLIVAGSGGLIGGAIGSAYNGDFNSGWDYGTIIGGTIGLIMAVPPLMGVTTSITLPTFGWLSTTAGSVVLGVTGSIAVTVPVGAIASGIAASGLVYYAYQRKPAAPRIRNNSRKKHMIRRSKKVEKETDHMVPTIIRQILNLNIGITIFHYCLCWVMEVIVSVLYVIC